MLWVSGNIKSSRHTPCAVDISTNYLPKLYTQQINILHVLLNYVILNISFSERDSINVSTNFQIGNIMEEERQNPDEDLDQLYDNKLYELYVKDEEELSKRELSNVENLDKAILSLSSAGLGLSLVFIRNVVELTEASHLWLLHLSWGMFILAIISTLSSYLFGQSALNKQRDFNEKYYFLEGDEDAGQQMPLASKITYWLSYVSVFAYIAAVICTAFFIRYN